MAFAFGRGWLGLGGGRPVVLEGFLDPPCSGGADALVDRECLLQVRCAVTGVAVQEG